jgi:integrase
VVVLYVLAVLGLLFVVSGVGPRYWAWRQRGPRVAEFERQYRAYLAARDHDQDGVISDFGPASEGTDLVFCTRTGRPLEHRSVARRWLARAAKLAGLDGDGQRIPTFHELRHAHASAWIAAGGDLVELSARLGHRDPAITAAVYSHDFEAAARSDQRRARLDALYGADDGSLMAATEVNGPQTPPAAADADVTDLQAIRERRQ